MKDESHLYALAIINLKSLGVVDLHTVYRTRGNNARNAPGDERAEQLREQHTPQLVAERLLRYGKNARRCYSADAT